VSLTDPDIASDQEAGCLPPRERYDLLGHLDAERAFQTAWESGRLHHAWLISGPKGIGKATLAWRMARRVLGAAPDTEYGILGSSPRDPASQLLEAGANPDLLMLRRPWDDKRKRWRAEITVDEARKAPSFFEKSAGAGGWRVCIVDSADDMNRNAANALLKTLEEPPKRGILILISHSPGRLPATIRSRCRKLVLRAPEPTAVCRWLSERNGVPSEASLDQLVDYAGASPGRALALAIGDGASLIQDVDALVKRGKSLSDQDARRIADRVTGKGREDQLAVFYEALARAYQAQALQCATDGRDPKGWIKAWADIAKLVRDAEALYLDPKQTVLQALSLTRTAATTS